MNHLLIKLFNKAQLNKFTPQELKHEIEAYCLDRK